MDILKIFQEKLSQNSYLIVDEKDAILIDAGAFIENIEENLRMFNPKPKLRAVFITHCHFDHVAQLDNILTKYKCPAYIFKDGKSMLYDENKNLSCLDIPFKIKNKQDVKTFLDSESFEFGNINITCYNTPGHSVDSSCFVVGENMFTGDTIFRVEVGRTDLYSSDENVQRISLERLKNDLSNGVNTFYPGHGANFNNDELKYTITRILGEN